MKRTMVVLAVVLAGVSQLQAGASELRGAQVVVASGYEFIPGGDAYGPVVVMEGSSLFFTTAEYSFHDIVSEETGPSGEPLFTANGTCCGWLTPVRGVSELRQRDEPYRFACSIHPFQRGRLVVV